MRLKPIFNPFVARFYPYLVQFDILGLSIKEESDLIGNVLDFCRETYGADNNVWHYSPAESGNAKVAVRFREKAHAMRLKLISGSWTTCKVDYDDFTDSTN